MKKSLVAAAGFAALSLAPAWGFSFNDIHYWVGEGTNRVGFVVDWGGTAKAWGYRWNGDAPMVGAIIRAVVAHDGRLMMDSDVTQYGLYMKRFGYDSDDNGAIGEGEPDVLEYSVYNPNSPYAAWGEEYAYDYYAWNMLQGATGEAYDTNSLTWTDGADSVIAQPETWYMVAFGLYGDVTLTEPTAADEAPFHMRDIQFWLGSGTNRVGFVVDWGGTAKAWGYRWNGDAPMVGAIIRAVVAHDGRLTMDSDVTQYGLYMKRFGYDSDDNGAIGEGEPDVLEYSVYNPNSPYAAWGEEYAYDYYAWNMLQGATGEAYNTNSLTWTDGADSVIAQPETWYMVAFGLYGDVALSKPSSAIVSSSAVQFAKVGDAAYSEISAAVDAARGGKSLTMNESFVKAFDVAEGSITFGSEGNTVKYIFPGYYSISVAVSNGLVAVTASLKEARVRPTFVLDGESARKPFSVEGNRVVIVPGNVIDGLYYGISATSDLSVRFSAPVRWVRAENGTVTLDAETCGMSGFYKVRVSDIDESVIKY